MHIEMEGNTFYNAIAHHQTDVLAAPVMNNLLKLYVGSAEGAPLRQNGSQSFPYIKFTWENIGYKTSSRRGPDAVWDSTFILTYTANSSPNLIIYVYDGGKGNDAMIGCININFSKLKVAPILQGVFTVQGAESMSISLCISGNIGPPVSLENVSRIVQPMVPYTPPKFIQALPPVKEEKVALEAIENETEIQQETTVESAVGVIESELSTPLAGGDVQALEDLQEVQVETKLTEKVDEVYQEEVPKLDVEIHQKTEEVEETKVEIPLADETEVTEVIEEVHHELEEVAAPGTKADSTTLMDDIEFHDQEEDIDKVLENEIEVEAAFDEDGKDRIDIEGDDVEALVTDAAPTEEEIATAAVYESVDMELVKDLKAAFPQISFQLIINIVKEGGSEDDIKSKIEQFAIEDKIRGLDFVASSQQHVEELEEQTYEEIEEELPRCNYSDLFDKEVSIPEAKYGVNLLTSLDDEVEAAPSATKKALFVAINYLGTSKELSQCISAADMMKSFIIENYGFSDDEDSIVFLRDDADDPHFHPTFHNIIKGMTWLTQGAQAGDILFFHFCGESAYQASEIDGKEAVVETIIPLDYENFGVITNEELHSCLVERLPSGALLAAIIDGYNAATGLDLPFVFDPSMYLFSMAATPRPTYGDVICFSGCRENVFGEQAEEMDAGGEFTKAFLSVTARDPNGYTLEALQHALATQLKENPTRQVPLLTSNQKIPPHREFNFVNIIPNGNRLIGRAEPKFVHKEEVIKQLSMTYGDDAPKWV